MVRKSLTNLVKMNRYGMLKRALALRQRDLSVLMENVTKPHNLGAVMRTAEAVGVANVHAVFDPAVKKNKGTVKGAAKGTERWIEYFRHSSVVEAIEEIRAREPKVQVIAADLEGEDFREYDFTQPTCILLGQEENGVSDVALRHVDRTVTIPMFGMVESLNVGVAASVMLYEAQRQRSNAGMYQKRHVDPIELDKNLVSFLHPQVAEFCQNANLPYPKLDENGQIDDPEWMLQRRKHIERVTNNL